MACSIDDGGPAFPRTASDADRRDDVYSEVGMSLRDYFAAAALQGMLSRPPAVPTTPRVYAADAYAIADVMLAKRRGQS